MSGGVGGVRGILRASRDSRYSGTRRGIGGIRRHWGLLWGCRGSFGGIRGASGGVGVRGVLGLVGTLGTEIAWRERDITRERGYVHL